MRKGTNKELCTPRCRGASSTRISDSGIGYLKEVREWVCAAQLSTYHAVQCLCVLLCQDQNVVTEEHAQFASALRFVQEALPQ